MRVSLKRAVALVVTAPAVAWACCAAPRPQEKVQIADQEIVVTWDAKTKQEHFIRRAKFNGAEGKDFGFLVPTPAKPDLGEAPDALFDHLVQLTLPEHVTKYVPNFTPLLLRGIAVADGARFATGAAPPPTAAMARSVTVLEQKRVAGFDAVVLEATDALALTSWLKEHDYAVRPEITDWAEPYVAAKWKITAFKLPGGAPRVETSAVRMSFTSERPLFPYRTPTDNRAGGGTLRVYLVGAERLSGSFGTSSAPWKNAHLVYASEHAKLADVLAKDLPKVTAPEGRWLTVYDDTGWPGSGDDLYFGRDENQARVVPPPIIDEQEVPVPLDVLAFSTFSVGGVIFFVKRRAARKG